MLAVSQDWRMEVDVKVFTIFPVQQGHSETKYNPGWQEDPPRRPSTNRVNNDRWLCFAYWAAAQGIDPLDPTAAQIAAFLYYPSNYKRIQVVLRLSS